MGESQKKRQKRKREAAELVAHARQVRNYLSNHAGENPLFEPEREIASQIVDIMEGSDRPDPSAVASLLESLDGTDHYNGSGWLDFTMTVRGWIAVIEGRKA